MNLKLIFMLFSVYVVSSTQVALAYLDPITGSIIIQGFLAAIATVAVFFRKKFAVLFGSKKDSSVEDGE